MKKRQITAISVVCAVGVAATAAYAHHSFATFDHKKIYIWEGTVVEYVWRNPHSHIIVNVPKGAKDPATVGTWDIEGGAAIIMTRQGWNKSSYKAGDKIVVVGQPARDGKKAGSLYYAVKDGKRLYHDVDRRGGPGAQGEGIPAGVVLP